MPQIRANGIALEVERRGPGADTPIVLIMGLGGQLTRWSEEFVETLTREGQHVIRFDNRDIGLSEKFDHAGPPDMPAIIGALSQGKPPPVAYTLDDMARDVVGLLDALDIARAHIVGASMGGMIAQLVAADHGRRVASLTSIMSTTGARGLPPAKPEAIAVLNNRGPDPKQDLDGYLDHAVKSARVIGSPGFPVEDAAHRARILSDYRRAFTPHGFLRQYAAIIAAGDRLERLARIAAPTVVIHGVDDPLVPIEGGRDTAARIPGAELIEIEGMGHDIPPQLYDRLAAGILSAVRRA